MTTLTQFVSDSFSDSGTMCFKINIGLSSSARVCSLFSLINYLQLRQLSAQRISSLKQNDGVSCLILIK